MDGRNSSEGFVRTSVLITGGAGFIGRTLARSLVDAGYDVAVMDVLHPQVHSALGIQSLGLPASVQLFPGDVSHAADCDAVLRLVRPSQVVHLAAETGTGQSLLESTRHGTANVVGTTQLLDALTRANHVPDHLVLASTRAVYGEGAWKSAGEIFYPRARSHAQLLAGEWDPKGRASQEAVAIPSCASRTEARPTSVYAATKLAQEHIMGAWANAHDVPLSILRLQNVFGPGQSLTNPYTGVVSLFARLARTQQAIEVYEDGQIVRDFVFLGDVVQALLATVRKPPSHHRCLDVGSGSATTIHALALELASICDAPEPVIVAKFRDGDVRAASCAIGPTQAELLWQPTWTLRAGLHSLIEWIDSQP